MKLQLNGVNTRPAKTPSRLLAAFIIPVLTFSVLPMARSADLYSSTEIHRTPPLTIESSSRIDPDSVYWTDTSIAHFSLIDGDVAHFLGSKAESVTLDTNIPAGGTSFGFGASTFAFGTTGNVLTANINDANVAGATQGGLTEFLDPSGADSATITNNSSPVSSAGGTTVFRFTLRAGSATNSNDGGSVNGVYSELGK
jgi:hypothetical protein